MKCHVCDGTGYKPWKSLSRIFEYLDIYRSDIINEKIDRPLPTFREWLTIARGLWLRGQDCYKCGGDGEI